MDLKHEKTTADLKRNVQVDGSVPVCERQFGAERIKAVPLRPEPAAVERQELSVRLKDTATNKFQFGAERIKAVPLNPKPAAVERQLLFDFQQQIGERSARRGSQLF